MTYGELEKLLIGVAQNQAQHEENFRRLEELQMKNQAQHEENFRRLEEGLRRQEENQAQHEANLRRLEELQMENQIAITRLNGLIADIAARHDENLLRVENAVASLAAQVETFVRRSPNGGQQ